MTDELEIQMQKGRQRVRAHLRNKWEKLRLQGKMHLHLSEWRVGEMNRINIQTPEDMEREIENLQFEGF